MTGKRPAVRPPFVSHGRSLAHASLAPSGRNEWSREAAVSDMSRRPTDPPIPPPTPWLAPRHLPHHSPLVRLGHRPVPYAGRGEWGGLRGEGESEGETLEAPFLPPGGRLSLASHVSPHSASVPLPVRPA